ncbi:phytase domain-containing protein [Stutzerimonas stutzeri ATCC 14405 = CCUG 16156]|uniref:phytase n=1 Tax=Stutzerimonas stutzeri TaxID=316 RepID=UPI0002549570|nr:phytase [Stutzerimonas stutzeri]EHY77146.1 phytase domain-containing protein [Stutzerimonas stutzeri ATCC 14405 = CCUG 16156]QOZ95690.1 phytase [Stutzerimonas stutzeri]
MYALSKTALLGLCIALAACQSVKQDEPSNAVQLSSIEPVQDGLEYAQLMSNTPWSSAERIQLDAKGLHLVDASGRTLAEYAGRFEGLDHRADQQGLLLATVERKRQQAMLIGLDAKRAWSQPLYLPRTAFAIEGLCLYRDSARNDFVFLVGEEGVGEQWLVASQGRLLGEARRVRGLSLPPQSAFCQTDDAGGQLYVNEENVGLWRYPADAEAPLQREPVDLRQPFGHLAEAAAGMALVPGGLLALDPEAPALHLYRQTQDGWKADGVVALEDFDEPEQISARRTQDGIELLLADERGLHRARLAWQPQALAQTAPIISLPAAAETDAVPSLGDAADDPAIWVHPRNPAQSRVLGTDKKGGLLVYDLNGREVQDLRVGRLNNVDVRSDFRLGAKQVDLAVASNRDRNSLHLFAIDRVSGMLADIGQIATPLTDIYGLCMFKDRQGGIHAIANDKDGTFVQYRLDGTTGQPRGELVRRFKVETQPEGCVADDRNERLFVGEEDVAVWVLDARAEAPTALEKVIDVGGPVHDDIEGLALYQGTRGDYLVISSQGNDSYVVLDAQAPYAVRGAFRIGLNAERGIDGASETDGLEVTSANLGGIWGRGMLVVQDGRKRMPEGAQNYKYLPWSAVADALGLD